LFLHNNNLEYKIGDQAYTNGMFDVAIKHFNNALNFIKMPSFYFALGNCLFHKKKYDEAIKNYEIAIALFKEISNLNGEAAVKGNIGAIYYEKGDTYKALSYFQEAFCIFSEIGDTEWANKQLENINSITLRKNKKKIINEQTP